MLEKVQLLYIPLKSVHRLENPNTASPHRGQTGDYMAEDNIVRLDDGFKRSSDD